MEKNELRQKKVYGIKVKTTAHEGGFVQGWSDLMNEVYETRELAEKFKPKDFQGQFRTYEYEVVELKYYCNE